MTTLTPPGETTWKPDDRRRRWLMYPLLAMMALADAYAFWTTLDVILGKDKEFLLVMVIALSLGTVIGAHELGRMARQRKVEAATQPMLLIIGLAAVWCGLGLTMYWIRAHQDDSIPVGTGTLQLPALSTNDSSQPTFALLLLGLYLLTGALAYGHAYRFGDPRSAELLAAIRKRTQLNRERVQRLYDLQCAENLLQQRVDDQERESAARDRKNEEAEAWGNQLSGQEELDTIELLGDPAATDARTRRNGAS